VFEHFGLFLRSSAIGSFIGMIPAVGGTVASFVAYGHAVQSGGRDPRFGHGDIRGVIAPEAAHDAKDGGSLVPTLAFGIPGNEGAALLLAALALHGVLPGRELMTTRLDLVFVIIWSLFLSNWMTSLLGLACVGPLAHLTIVRTDLLAPFVLSMAALGAFAASERIEDVFVAFGAGITGYYMRKHGWPRIPLVIALLLGGTFEMNLHVTARLHELGRIDFFTRPGVLALVGLTAATLFLRPWQRRRDATPAGRTDGAQ
jgi:putative tricarboxylic transport membrane protein